MQRIAISQRRDKVAGRDETRDGLDVRWAYFLHELDFLPVPVCSALAQKTGYLEALQPEGILLTGGNDLGQEPMRDKLEENLLTYAIKHRLPVLGVCRGMQIINSHLGGALAAINGHVALRHELQGDWAKKQGYNYVNSYHCQAIIAETLANELVILATTNDGVIEALGHKTLPWLGIMWHPEREEVFSKADKKLIKEHFKQVL